MPAKAGISLLLGHRRKERCQPSLAWRIFLGLPASRDTLSILRNLIDPDVPRRLLEPLRALLWRPEATFVLQRMPALTDQQLSRYCHALAA